MIGYDGRESRMACIFQRALGRNSRSYSAGQVYFSQEPVVIANLARFDALAVRNPVAYNQYIALKDGDEILLPVRPRDGWSK